MLPSNRKMANRLEEALSGGVVHESVRDDLAFARRLGGLAGLMEPDEEAIAR